MSIGCGGDEQVVKIIRLKKIDNIYFNKTNM